MDDIAGTLSTLLSLRSSAAQLNGALVQLNSALASIALESSRVNFEADGTKKARFVKSQEGFQHNVTSRLIDFLARCLLRLQFHKYGDDYHAIFGQLGQTLKLLQGFLLLHRASRSLFSIPCNMELLVSLLTLPDQSQSAVPPTPKLGESTTSVISASPSLASVPFDFAASAGPSADPDTPPTLAELALETLLCALVDTPENVRLFEELGGVAEVVKILRGKVDGGKAAKMKSLEFLYFWLYPDAKASPSVGDEPPSSAPATPRRPSRTRTDRLRAGEGGCSSDMNSEERPQAYSAARQAVDVRLRAMLESTSDAWSPATPSKSSRTLESTQLALSRSAALAASSPRKRCSRVSFDADDEEVLDDRPRSAKRSSFNFERPTMVAPSPRRLPSSPSSGELARRASPIEDRRRSVLGTSAFASASRSNYNTPPSTPGRRASMLANAKPTISRSPNLSKSAYPASPDRADMPVGPMFRAPRLPSMLSTPRKTSISPSAAQRSSHIAELQNVPAEATPTTPSGRTASAHATARPLPRSSSISSLYTARRQSRVFGDDRLPGSDSATAGLFAPAAGAAYNPRKAKDVPKAVAFHSDKDEGQRKSTAERRRSVLGQYLGNVDQLMERFEILRCGEGLAG